jgi:hypothetical protein
MIVDEVTKKEFEAQALFVLNPSLLPIELRGNCTVEDFEKIGVKLGPEIDKVFTTAQLPSGWYKTCVLNNQFWSTLNDEKDRVRVELFYAYDFGDLRAHMRLLPYYIIWKEYLDGEGVPFLFDGRKTPTWFQQAVKSPSGETLFYSRKPYPTQGHNYIEDLHSMRSDCQNWLDANFPQWRDCTAYWD